MMFEPESATRSPLLHASSTGAAHLDDLWDFAQPVESALRFANAAQDASRIGDIDCELEALTQQARGLGLAGEFDWAHSILDIVDGRLRLANNCRAAVRARLERGRAFNSAQQATLAKPQFLRAWELAREGGEDGLAVDAAHMVAIASASEPDVALAWNLSALEFAERSRQPDARRWLGALYNNIGWTYFEKGNLQQSLAVFERAVELRKQEGVGKSLLIAKWCVARTLRALQRTAEALAAQLALLQEYEVAGIAATGFVYEELGECTLELGKQGHQGLFRRAHELLSQDDSFAKHEPARLARLWQLGQS
jgi:tetratricopeptide (TPR) repeat protein